MNNDIYIPSLKLVVLGLDPYRVRDAMRSACVIFSPALYLVKLPDAVSNERSVPTATKLFPTTPEKLTMGFAVKPMLVLIPAYSCRYWSSTY